MKCESCRNVKRKIRTARTRQQKEKDKTEKEAIIGVHTFSRVFITNLSSNRGLRFAHIFRMASILSLKEERTVREQQELRGRKVVKSSNRKLGKKKKARPRL